MTQKMKSIVSLVVAVNLMAVTVMAGVVAAWDFGDRRQSGVLTPGWTAVSFATMTDGTGSTVNGVNVKLTGGSILDEANQINEFVSFVVDGTPLVSVSSTDKGHQRVYEDFFANVRTGDPTYTISGLTADQGYTIQFLGHFNGEQQITVTQDGVPQGPIQLAGNATAGEVVYSVHYSFTATASDPDVEFTFDGASSGDDHQYGPAGLVVAQATVVPEPVAPVPPVITRVGIEDGGSTFSLSWTSMAGQQFDLLNSDDLSNWTRVVENLPASATNETSYGFEIDATKERQFYKVGLREQRKPNVIMLFADDLGYGDIGCYGHPYAKTPNLDKLATEGTLFRKFNVTGVTCNPSRTGLLTGRHPKSFPQSTADVGFQGRVTIMELLNDAGYKTGHFGKWHIGPDESNGTYGIDDIIVSGGGGNHELGRDQRIYDNAIAFIGANKDIPFYMNVMGRVTHSPVDPRPELVESAGFSDLVVDRNAFSGQQLQGRFDQIIASGGNIDTGMANYVTEVFYLDQFIGDLLAKLDELGLRENTIVVFSSDQGAAVPRLDPPVPAKEYNLVGWSGGLRGQKHDQHEGGIRSPFIIRWPGHVPAGKINTDSITSALDWLPTLCHIADVPIDPTQFHGEDVLDIWMGSDRSRNGPQFWNSSMKKDDWRIYFQSGGTTAVELFDLSTDLSETNNLLNERPQIVAELTSIWRDWKAALP